MATSVTISTGTYSITAGQTDTSDLVNGGTLDVLSGGTADLTIVSTRIMNVSSGGSASGTTVSASGTENVWGTDVSDTISGTQYVFSGGVVSNGTVNGGFGYQEVDGGTLVGETLTNLAYEVMSSGGTASNTTVTSNASQDIFSGTASNTSVTSGGIQYLEDAGAVAISTAVGSRGEQDIFSGGSASDTTIQSGGIVRLQGGTLSAVTIDGGGILQLSAGSLLEGGVTFAGVGGILEYDPTPVPGATIMSGATISGFANGDEIDLASLTFAGGGSATLSAGNLLQISEGGNTYNLQFDGSQNFSGTYFHLVPNFISNALTDRDGTVVLDGQLSIVSGGLSNAAIGFGNVQGVSGSAVSTTISAGGMQEVYAGGVATSTTVTSGYSTVFVGGSSFDDGANAYQQIDSGGLAVSASFSGGVQWVMSGGTASGTDIANGAAEWVYGTATGTILEYHANWQFVGSGGVASGTIDSGSQTISSGGTATGTDAISGGDQIILSGGAAYNTDVNSGVSAGTYLSAVQTISAGGLASGTIIGLLGSQTDSGTAINTTVNSGGLQFIGPLATATSTTLSGSGFFGSTIATTQDVYAGTAIDTVVGSGAYENVWTSALLETIGEYGVTSDSIIESGGYEIVSGGGIASDTTISGGTLELVTTSLGVGAISGYVDFAGSGGLFQIYGSSMPTATISGFAAGDKIDLPSIAFSSAGTITLLAGNTLDIIEGGHTYSLQLDPSQNFTGETFSLTVDSGTGTDIVINGSASAVASLVVDGGSSVPVGSAGASAVAFTISGIDSDDNGTVIFTDGSHSATVTITNGTASVSAVSLSSFNDDIAIAASLHVTDASNTLNASATNLILDKDAGETAVLTVDGGATATLGSAGAAAVTFTVTGLASDDNGSVVFTDGTHSQTVAIASGTAVAPTVDLASFDDARLTASLSVTDTAGNSFTAVATNLTLDPDYHETATLSAVSPLIGSAGASAVKYVVTGLDGETGSMTLTDGGTSSVAAVNGNGTYTFNLAAPGFGDGTLSVSLTVSDPAGNSFSASNSAVVLDKDAGETATLALSGTAGSVAAHSASFTISGLDAGDTGAGNTAVVTFLEGGTAVATSTVQIGGTSAVYTADLSSVGDGTLSTTLTMTDSAGNTFIASGGTLVLDQDKSETATLALSGTAGSAGAHSVSFTISGLDTGDTGAGNTAVVTFLEGGTAVATSTVQIVGTSAVYTANLSTVSDGTVSATLTVTDSAGNVFAASSGGGAVLDNDAGETATLSLVSSQVGSAGASAVSFIVTGLNDDTGPGNTGTVSFIEGVSSVTVGITGNGTYTANLATLGDGTISTTLSLTDAASNIFTASGGNVVLDRDAGETATLALSGTAGSVAAHSVSYTISGLDSGDIGAGNTAVVTFLEGGTAVATSTVQIAGASAVYTADLSTVSDGTVSATLTVTDSAGNHFTASGGSLVLDRDAGETATVAMSGTAGSVAAHSVSFTISGLDAGDTGAGNTAVVTFLEGGTAVATSTVQIAGASAVYTADLSMVTDGTVSATLTVTDSAGNTFTASGGNVLLDRDAGETATLSLVSSQVGSAGVSAVSFVVTGLNDDTGAGNTGTVSFVEGGSSVTVGITGNGTYSANLSTLGDGTISTTLSLTDAASNVFTASGGNVVLDRDAGETATLAMSGTAGSVAAHSASFTISGLDAGDSGAGNTAVVTFLEGGVSVATSTVQIAGTSAVYTADLSGVSDGTVSATLTVTDSAGNHFTASGGSLVLDRDAGETAILALSGTAGSVAAHSVSVTISGLDIGDTGAGNTAVVTFLEGGVSVATSTVQIAGTSAVYTADLSTVSDGTVSATLTVTDSAGNTFTASGGSVVLDKDAGETAILALSGTADSVAAHSVSFTISGLDAGDTGAGNTAVVTFLEGGTAVATSTVQIGGTSAVYTADLSGVSDGTVSATLTVTDSAGNTFTASGGNVVLDRDASETATLGVANTTETAGAATATFVVSGLDPADSGGSNTGTVDFVEGSQSVTVSVTGDGTYTANLSGLPVGTATTTLSFTDAAGNGFSASGPNVTLVQSTASATLVVDGGSSVPVGSAGASAVAFTIFGIDADDNGSVVFSDGTNSLTVGVTSGTASVSAVNLSSFNDDVAISASLHVTDASSNTLTASATNLILDKDSGETATLALSGTAGSVAAHSVIFTISGLDAADTGAGNTAVVTFLEGGTAVATSTVQIAGTSAVYTADLSTVTDGTVSATLTVTDSAGNHFTASGGSVVLDKDAGETATLAMSGTAGSVAAHSASFTISGLDAGDSGAGNTAVVTFLEGGVSVATSTVQIAGTSAVYTADLSGVSDGTVSATLTVTDSAGNHFTASGGSLVLDRDAGETAILALSGTAGSVAAHSVSVTISGLDIGDTGAGNTAVVTFLEGGVSVATSTVQIAGTSAVYTADLSGVSDGTVSATLTVTDSAGNMFTASGGSLLLDRDAGETAILALSGTADSVAAHSVSFTISGLDAGDTGAGNTAVVTFLEGGVSVATSTVQITGTSAVYTADLSSVSDGTVSATLTVTDSAGNIFTASGGTLVLDQDKSETATLALSGTAGSVAAHSVSFTISGLDTGDTGAGNTAVVTFLEGGVSVATSTVQIAGTSAVYTANLSTVTDGTVSATLTVTDSAGNVFTASGGSLLLDRDAGETAALGVANTTETAGAATATFVVSGLDPADSGGSNTGTVDFVEGSQSVTVSVTGDGTYTANLSGLPVGTATTTLSFTDAAGNGFSASGPNVTLVQSTASATLVVDGGSSVPVGSAGASAVAFTIFGIDADDNGSVVFSDGTNSLTVGVTSGTASVSAVNLSSFNDDVAISASLHVTDASSNTLTASATNLILDKDSGETATLALSGTAGSVAAHSASFTISGLDAGDSGAGNTAVVTFLEGGVSVATSTVQIGGTSAVYTADLSGVSDGTVSATLTVTDSAGNTFTASGGNVVLDRDASETATLGVTNVTETAGAATATLVVSGLDPADSGGSNTGTVDFIEGSQTIAVGVTGGGTYTANLSGLPVGTATTTLSFTDAAGNSFAASGPNVTLVQSTVSASLVATISGTPEEGQLLTATVSVAGDTNTGTFSYQWEESSNGGTSWITIAGATASTYTIQEGDENDELRLSATFVDSTNQTLTGASNPTSPVKDIPPTLAVTISGTLQESSTLTAVPTITSDETGTVAYQWLESSNGTGFTAVAGATASTYVLAETDENHFLEVTGVFVDDTGQTVTATSTATPAVKDIPPTLSVTISGTLQESSTLTAVPMITSDETGTVAYQWLESTNGTSFTAVAGATASTYVLAEPDENHVLEVTAVFVDDTSQTVSATSTATTAVKDIPPTLSVAVTGTLQESQTLTAVPTVTSDESGTVSYQWAESTNGSSWTTIAGATASTYVLAEADENQQMEVTAVFVDDTGQTVSATSTSTTAVKDVPPTLSVTITGTLQDGQTVTALPAITSDDAGTVSYQWAESTNGTSWTTIGGATASTYILAEGDEGQELRVTAAFIDDTNQTVSATSAPTALVTEPPPNLTLASATISISPGGSASLGISVSGFDSDDTVNVTITGMTKDETITDLLDGKKFNGKSAKLTEAEVNSGVILVAKNGKKVTLNTTLTLTATDATTGETATSAPQFITVLDPPATTSGTNLTLLNQFAAAGFDTQGGSAGGSILTNVPPEPDGQSPGNLFTNPLR